ncbi:MAG: 2-oxoglutarate dehydrogenase, E2 component, dihydrolipoamide succinyltransferase [Candidatus Kapaibacterium sp.]|nr:MAG: 2-oxoglutarate dehydrogenase, E2 component, dihydrolipoamide succinyltransferase [Candidatus Kapabacteria bacterium]
MARVEVVMPKMGESIQEGKILNWLKKVGDNIERDEILLEISTDKVDTEVPAPNAGVVAQVLYQVGDTVEVGTVIAYLETDVNASVSAPAAPAPAPAPAPVAAAPAPAPAAPAPAPVAAAPAPAAPAPAPSGALTDVVMPKMGESIQEGKILNWLKKEGDKVERDEILLEISTDKVDTEVPSPVAGTLAKVLYNVGDTVEVGVVIAQISGGATASVAAAAPAPAPVAAVPVAAPAPVAPAPVAASAPAPAHGGGSDVGRGSSNRFYSPLVRSMAKVENISSQELDALQGTGLEGRVTKNDVLLYLQNRGSAPRAAATTPVAVPAPAVAAAAPATPVAAPSAPAPSFVAPPAPVGAAPALGDEQIVKKYGQNIEIIGMDRVRERIASHMVQSVHTSPHVTLIAEADVTNLVRIRERYKAEFEKREGQKLTFTPLFIHAIVEAVKKCPMVNVSVEGTKIIRHRSVHFGMATALPDGNLIVPVIKNADVMNLTGIARSVNDLATRARAKKLSPDDISGGTITLTNFGTFNILTGTPIINQPQCAIVGLGAIEKRPVVRELDGEDVVVVRSMSYISVTVDHRVIDGMLGGQFLKAIVDTIQGMNDTTVKI